jgi:azurin
LAITMKKTSHTLLGAALIALLTLTGCGRSGSSDAAATSAAAPSTEKAAGTVASAATKPADGRVVEIHADDTMKFTVTEIHAKPGEALAVTLKNVGTVPKFSMGHNWVLVALGTDMDAFASAASEAATTDYVPAAFKDQILAETKLLGPGESDTAHFYAPTKPGHYPFLCTFPGHYQVGMKGDLIVE